MYEKLKYNKRSQKICMRRCFKKLSNDRLKAGFRDGPVGRLATSVEMKTARNQGLTFREIMSMFFLRTE
jgi:hypothetical protein